LGAGRRSWNCRTGVHIRGTIAWVAWLALHLVTLLGNRNGLSALVNLGTAT
jgi:NADH dehydrogenase FAD-containing subunit